MKLNIVGPAYQFRTVDFDYQRCINWYPVIDQGGKEVMSLFPTPGYNLFSTPSSTGEVRGLFTHKDVGYAVVSNTLYTVDDEGTATSRGTLNTSSGKVYMAANPTQVMITDGIAGYIYTISTATLAQITDADFPQEPIYLTFQSSYFVIVDKATGRFYWSNSNDGTAWTATDFATPNYKPDALKACISFREELLMFGDTTLEFYYDDGSTPFVRRTGTSLFAGTAAVDSVAAGPDMVAWLAKNEYGEHTVMAMGVGMLGNFQPMPISTDAINSQLRESGEAISGARAFIYQNIGHTFYVLNIAGGGRTFVYDFTTKLWHERRSISDATNTEYVSWRAGSYMNLKGMHIVGDTLTGKLYELKDDVFTENGKLIHRLRTTPHLMDENRQLTLHQLDIETASGVGITTGQGSDPQLMLRVSHDGGHTWGNQLWRNPGKKGEYRQRCQWNTLGTGRDWVFELSTTDPVDWTLIGGYARGSQGTY